MFVHDSDRLCRGRQGPCFVNEKGFILLGILSLARFLKRLNSQRKSQLPKGYGDSENGRVGRLCRENAKEYAC